MSNLQQFKSYLAFIPRQIKWGCLGVLIAVLTFWTGIVLLVVWMFTK